MLRFVYANCVSIVMLGVIMLSVNMLLFVYAEHGVFHCYAECCYAKCH